MNRSFLRLARIVLFLAFVLSGCAHWSLPLAEAQEPPRQVIDAIIQAIKDEIYAYDSWKFYPALPLPQPLRLYIKPYDPAVRKTFVIYRHEPFGEVYREAYMQKDGLVLLAEDPRRGFPPTRGWAMRTVDMDDDEVMKFKRTWVRVNFALEMPSPLILEESTRRQNEREKRNLQQ